MGVFQRRIAFPALGLALMSGLLLTGCKRDAEFSQTEVNQLKQGPPKEMPPQARAMLEKAMQQGRQGAPAAPPTQSTTTR